MRVAIVTHYMPPHVGGVEQVAALLARVYAAAGHDVTWIACAEPEPARETLDNGVRLVRVPALNFLERRLAMPYPLPLPRARDAIDRVVRAADVVHLHDCLYLTSLWAHRTARRTGIPTVVTQHVAMVSFGGGLIDPLLFGAYRTVGRGVLRGARTVAFVSETVRDWFLAHVDEDLRATLIPNAVDTERFRPASPAERARARAALGIPSVGPVVLFAGRLVPKKNLPALVDAMSRGNAHLLVVGDGPERGTLAPLGTRVTHLARIEHERMPEVFTAVDLFALPSVGEGLPLSLIEAMASGLPCVVSDDPAFAQLAPRAGVVRVPLRALAGAIGAALGTPDALRQAQSAAVRSWAVERYSVASFSRGYLELIDEAARER